MKDRVAAVGLQMGPGAHVNVQSPPVNVTMAASLGSPLEIHSPLAMHFIQLILPEHLLGARPCVGTKV